MTHDYNTLLNPNLNDDAIKKVKLEMDYKQTISTILKDSKGDPSKNKLIIDVGLTVKNEKNKVLVLKVLGKNLAMRFKVINLICHNMLKVFQTI